MAEPTPLVAILQAGRLEYEALLLAASFAQSGSEGYQLTFLEPENGPLWESDPRAHVETRAALRDLGATIRPFSVATFGSAYPHGNKIEALAALGDMPFVFVDTDTLILGPLGQVAIDFSTPSASMRREGTWPTGDIGSVWRGLYEAFDLDIEPTLDTSFPADDWRRYLYFNAGFFYGASAQAFHTKWHEMAATLWRTPPSALEGQSLDPWLDQATLPLAIAALGGGRQPALEGLIDGRITCHYRTLPLLFAQESDAAVDCVLTIAQGGLKPLLRRYRPFSNPLYRTGTEIRETFYAQGWPDQAALRKALKAAGFWAR